MRSRSSHQKVSGCQTPEDRRALDHLFSVTYEELRRLASTVKRGDPGATLNPTALVNEAWIKLAHSPPAATTSQLHFKRIAARAMRQVLVDAARRRHSDKRGGPASMRVMLPEDGGLSNEKGLLALDDALGELERLEPRQALLVESRFFGGLEMAEIASLLEVSEMTVHRDWRVAKAWLASRLQTG